MEFLTHPQAIAVALALLAIAITGGMFVVPLYAFLTTTVTKDQTARTVAANNVVNSAAMVAGSVFVIVADRHGGRARQHAVRGRRHVPGLGVDRPAAAPRLRLSARGAFRK